MNTPILGYDERLPLYQRLREEMLAKIAAGEWMPGAPIPTEAELTRVYGVAIGTVRKAVDTLVNEGLLLRSQGRGTFVRRPNFDASLARFFRQVDASGGREIPGSRILARTVEEPADTVSAALRLQDGEKVIHLERLRIIEDGRFSRGHLVACHPLCCAAGSRHRGVWRAAVSVLRNPVRPVCRLGEGDADGGEADGAMARFLAIKEGAPMVIIERVALGYDRSPLEYRISRAAADGFRYQIDIS